MRVGFAFLLSILAVSVGFAADRHVDPRTTFHRVFAIVPMTGSGTLSDPRRPLHAPLPGEIGPKSGLMAFTFQPSDDDNFALVEIVAHDRSALASILNDQTVQAFEVGRSTPAQIETAFRKLRKDFSFSQFDEVPVR
jgi:hypothetical protein